MTKKKNNNKKSKKQKNVVVAVIPKPKKQRSRGARLGGRGDYSYGPFASLGSYAGRRAGGALDSYLAGSGDYSVSKNSIMPASSGVLNFQTNKHSHRISGSEFSFAVISSTAGASTFQLNNYYISPSNAALFPTLSQIAINYTEYIVHGLVFEYRPTSGDALSSTNTTLGRVCIATQYNLNAPNFGSVREMEGYEFSTLCKPSVGMLHPVECSPRESVTSVRFIDTSSNAIVNYGSGQFPTGVYSADRRLTFLGNLQVATDGFQGTGVYAGEVWAHWEVELLKPRIYTSLGNAAQMITYTGSTSAPISNSFWATVMANPPAYNSTNGIAVGFSNNNFWLQNNDGSPVNGSFLLIIQMSAATDPTVGTLAAQGSYSLISTTAGGKNYAPFHRTTEVGFQYCAVVYFTAAGIGSATNGLTVASITYGTNPTVYITTLVRLAGDFLTSQ